MFEVAIFENGWKTLDYTYEIEIAIDFARTFENAAVVDLNTGEIVWES